MAGGSGERPDWDVAAPGYDELAAALTDARGQIAELIEVNERLRARVAELEARLGRDSSNSSSPPSSEGLAKKPARARRSGGRRGKRPGAPGAHLARVAEPDEVVEHVPDACGGCGAGLGDAPVVGDARRQVFDLPRPRLRVVEHRAWECQLHLAPP